MKRILAPMIVGAIFLATTSCAEMNPPGPANGLRPVADAPTAIRLARLAWIGAHPELADRIGSEAVWQAHERAVLEEGVWTVWDPVPPNAIGGSLYILLSQADGRVLNMYLTQ